MVQYPPGRPGSGRSAAGPGRGPGRADTWHAGAIDAGASDVISPQDTEWGTRRARVLDPEGSIGTYRPGGAW